MLLEVFSAVRKRLKDFVLSVPVRWKIIGIGILPVVILGVSLNYWITSGLSDWLSYLLTDVRVEAAMQAGSRSVLLVTGIAAFFSIILLMLLVYILNSPLEELKRTAEEVASGQFETRAEVWANDEIGSLALSVNQMIDNFVEIQRDLSLTNQQLEAINRIALAADKEGDIHDVLYVMLESLLSLVNLEMGWVYLYDPELEKHHLASWKGVPQSLEQIFLNQEPDKLCACQQKLGEGALGDEVKILTCTRLDGCEIIEGQNTHITIPIKARGVWFGMINLHHPSAQEFDAETYELLSSIGTQISESVANAWFQIKLKEKEAARQLLLESLVNAQEDERSRLARELHDQAGQTLTNLLVRLKTIEKKSTEPEIKDNLGEALEIVAESIDSIRDLSYSLRPPALEEFGLGTAILALAEDMTEQLNIKVNCNCNLKCEIPSEIEVVLYRIVQEGLTNIMRHADASLVQIELECRENMFALKIDDNGCGFDPAHITVEDGQRHLGLIGMSERAELIGGRFNIYSAVGKGTTIEIFVPIPQTEMVDAGK